MINGSTKIAVESMTNAAFISSHHIAARYKTAAVFLPALVLLLASCPNPLENAVIQFSVPSFDWTGDIWMGEAASQDEANTVWGVPKTGWIYRNTVDRNVYRYNGSAWAILVDNSLRMETVTNIRVSGDYRPAQGARLPVLVYFTDNTIDDGYIDGATGAVVINHRRQEGSPEQTFHTLRLLDAPVPNKKILIGRTFDGETVDLSIDVAGDIQFRAGVVDPADGVAYIPIGTVAEFALINTDVTTLGGAYLQTHPLNMLGPQPGMDAELVLNWPPVGTGAAAQFTGTFDGGRKPITCLFIERLNDLVDCYIGLFGYIDGATLKNIAVSSGRVRGYQEVGGVAGIAYDSEISACSNAADIASIIMNTGGIVGQAVGTTITACANTGDVTNYDPNPDPTTGVRSMGVNGGVVGYCTNSSITACYNTGAISVRLICGGGVAGIAATTEITACYNTGSVDGEVYQGSGNWVGGVLGFSGQSGTSSGAEVVSCYWVDSPGDDATNFLGYWHGGGTPLDAAMPAFALAAWPSAAENTAWGSPYWQSLGTPSDTPTDFPKLWWED